MRTTAVALLAATAIFLVGCGSGAVNTTDPVGDWNATYGAPTTVRITNSNGVYTSTATAPVEVIGSHCFIPAGTVLSTFTGSAGSYAGEAGLWLTSNCTFLQQTPVTLKLDSAGQKLTFAGSLGGPVVYTRAPSGASSPDILLLVIVLVVLIAAGIGGFVLFRRRRNRGVGLP